MTADQTGPGEAGRDVLTFPPPGTIGMVEGRVAVCIGKAGGSRHWVWMNGDWTSIPLGRVEILGHVTDRAVALAQAKAEGEQAQARLRDLTRRLGFGDNITEPQADNDTIIRWSEERDAEAAEWREHQLWLNDCAEAGCDPLEDCPVHAPACHPAHPDAGQRVAARVEAVCADTEARIGAATDALAHGVRIVLDRVRAALPPDAGAAHDRRVRAQALRDAADAVQVQARRGWTEDARRAADWLRDRADREEAGEESRPRPGGIT